MTRSEEQNLVILNKLHNGLIIYNYLVILVVESELKKTGDK